MRQLRDIFCDHVGAGASVEQAMRMALDEAAAQLAQGRASSSHLAQIAQALGLKALLDQGLAAVLQFALTHWMNVPLSVLPGPQGVRGIPSPDCIEAQLPKDRPATREEVLRAWDQCTAAQQP